MLPYSLVTTDVKKATAFIAEEGRVVAFPTSTSYGLAADALQGFALRRLRNLKKRPDHKTFTIFLDPAHYATYLNLSGREQKLLSALKNKPLTLLVKPKKSLAHLAQHGLIGLRVIDHPLMAKLASAAARPLTATSANVSGAEPCLNPACIQKQFPGRLDETTYDLSLAAILDGGELSPALPTTIAQIDNGAIKIIRAGQLTPLDLQL